MARGCGCAGGTCSCLIQSTPTVQVTGHGTPDDPYVLNSINENGPFVRYDTPQGLSSAQQVQARANIGVIDGDGVGDIIMPSPTGIAATDDAALSAAITAATPNGRVLAQPGTYWISTHHIVPNTVDLVGAGGGSVSTTARTEFLCTTAVSQIEIDGGGDVSGHFRINGNLTATTPFARLGGAGANNRIFVKIIIINNAVSGTNSNDLSLIYGAQNDSWYDCGWAGADRDARVFDQGYGGSNFYNCKVNTAGRYADHYNNAVGGGVYPVPTEINHFGGIIEGNNGVSGMHVDAGVLISYTNFQFYSATAPTGPMIDIKTGCQVALIGQIYLQSTPSTQVAGTIGIRVAGTGSVTLAGYAQFQNFAVALGPDGNSSFVYPFAFMIFPNCASTVTATGGGSALQVAQLNTASLIGFVGTGATTVELNYGPGRASFASSRTINGAQNYYPLTGFGAPDLTVGRVAAGAWGVGSPLYILCTGRGATGSRPAAAAGIAGAIWVNTTTGTLDWCNGTTWISTISLASPAFTGTPTAPTQTPLDNSTKLATTAYTDLAVGVETTRATTAEGLKAPLASPALTGTPTAPTAAPGTSTTQLATTAYAFAAAVAAATAVATKKVYSVAYAATVTPALTSAQDSLVKVGQITGALALASPSGTAPVDGQVMEFRLFQDATGHAITLATTGTNPYKFGTDVTAAMIPATANAKFRLVCEWDATDVAWWVTAITRGF